MDVFDYCTINFITTTTVLYMPIPSIHYTLSLVSILYTPQTTQVTHLHCLNPNLCSSFHVHVSLKYVSVVLAVIWYDAVPSLSPFLLPYLLIIHPKYLTSFLPHKAASTFPTMLSWLYWIKPRCLNIFTHTSMRLSGAVVSTSDFESTGQSSISDEDSQHTAHPAVHPPKQVDH